MVGWLSLFFIRQPGLQSMQVIVGIDGSCEMLLYCTLHESQTNSLIEWMQEYLSTNQIECTFA